MANSKARRAPARAEEPFQASRRPTATSSQSAVRQGVRGACMSGTGRQSPGHRHAEASTASGESAEGEPPSVSSQAAPSAPPIEWPADRALWRACCTPPLWRATRSWLRSAAVEEQHWLLKRRKKEGVKSSVKKVAGEIWPDCSAVSPNLGDYSLWVRQRAPAKKKNDSLRLSDKLAVRLPSSSTLRLKAVTRRLW